MCPVFTVQSSVASYWRLTSLDTFTGQDWISTNSYRSFGQRLPGSQAVPPGTRIVHQQFTIEQLDSVWLPDAFTPVAVTGVSNVNYDPSSGSLITSHSTSDGLTYSVDSYQYLSTLDVAQLQAAPAVSITKSLHRYLELPSSVPADVYALARSITAGQTTEYAKAVALQNFFLSPAFTYSLNPPDDGYGIDALDELPVRHPDRVLSAVRRRLRGPGPCHRPAYPAGRRLRDRDCHRARQLPGTQR